jgi:hypothetical protein
VQQSILALAPIWFGQHDSARVPGYTSNKSFLTRKSQRMKNRKGLLLAMMEPPADIELAFHDWYDREHLPERVATGGFETARRFVCLSGWPRYLALYDLISADVLDGAAYRKLLEPPAHHTRDKVLGRYRFSGEQIYPGQGKLGDKGAYTRLMLLRFRGATLGDETRIRAGLRTNFDERAGVLQVRLFCDEGETGADYIATVECHACACERGIDPALFGSAARYLDVENVYTPYWRVTPT